jgi:hypothetical protein
VGVACLWGEGGPLPLELLDLMFAHGQCLLYFALLIITMLINSKL